MYPDNQYDRYGQMQNWGNPAMNTGMPAMATPGAPMGPLDAGYMNQMDMQNNLFSSGGVANAGGFSLPGQTPGGGNAGFMGGMNNFLSGFAGSKEAPGWGGMAVGAATGLANAYMGMKQYGLAKETLANNKEQFQMNFEAKKGMANSQMEDRQRARVASNASAYQSPSDYMTKYGVK